ncbi:MAG TPA: nuclear transport factor 2 family protein [Pseudolabrys sp.]|nr:nuclear transport factor 2 family protein [Pseudolabrys sp.]
MPTTTEAARAIFCKLEERDGSEFFSHVADDVDWTVEGTHPLAGRYRSKAALRAGAFDKLAPLLRDGVQLRVDNVVACDDWVLVELHAEAMAKNGTRFDNRYCWLARLVGSTIVEVRAYLDSALVQKLFDQSPVRATAAQEH